MTDDEKIVEALSSLGSMSSEMLAIYLEMDIASVRAILPLFDGNLWFQQADNLWHVMDEEGQEIYEQLARQEAARQKLPKYISALTKLRGLVSWCESTPIPLDRWTTNGVSKWMKQYNAALNLCQDLEDDLSERYIYEDLIDELTDLLSQAEQYKSYLPKQLVSKYADDRIRNSEAFSVLSHKPIHIVDAEMANTPINIFRRRFGGAQLQREDMPLIVHHASEEKLHYNCADVFYERMARIPELLREEEREYFKAYQQGNMAARDAIIESAIPSAMALAVKFLYDEDEYGLDIVPISHHISYEDLVQYVALIICESFNEYYPTPVTQFKRFALTNIRKRLGNFIVQEECILSYRKPSALELNGYHSSLHDTDEYASLGAYNYSKTSTSADVDYISVYGMEKDDFETWVAYIKDHPIRMVKELYQEICEELAMYLSAPLTSSQVMPASTPVVEEPVDTPKSKEAYTLDANSVRQQVFDNFQPNLQPDMEMQV